ncbi:hypothetical protein JIX56_41770 [Streptomyces sp. CA-210063]|nr:hypothetical protein [Streptomyces sp. CA-210063]UUU35848.1 hypothetical protein JIX56_41770 [Streptomyces sp. CA-210063]
MTSNRRGSSPSESAAAGGATRQPGRSGGAKGLRYTNAPAAEGGE